MSKKLKDRNNPELASLLQEVQLPKTFNKRAIITGKIISISAGEIVVDVNGRTEGVVRGKEMKLDGEKLNKKPGDSILVYVIKPENDEGQIELSIRRTGTARKWFELREAKEKDEPIEVTVIESNTGGVMVEIGGGLRGFVPSSQLKNNRIYTDNYFKNKEEATKKLQSKLAEMIGEKLMVKVVEIDQEKHRVILSEKYVYSEADSELRKETLESIKVGDQLSGEVTGIAPFGLFVNAKGLEGLVHLSEISWDKVINPADFYKVGDKVEVEVIGLMDSGKKIAYSIKRLKSDPWKNIVNKYKVGQIVKGTVKSIAEYGAFVKIESGLNGLIHISELSNKLVKDPSQIVQVGQDVEVMIISISNEDRHLGLSLKRLLKTKGKSEDESTDESSSREMEGLEEILEESTTKEDSETKVEE